MLGDVVSVLTQRAVPAAEIDAAVAQEQLASALTRRATPERCGRDRAIRQPARCALPANMIMYSSVMCPNSSRNASPCAGT